MAPPPHVRSATPLDAITAPAVVVDASGTIRATNEAWRLFATLNGAAEHQVGPGVDYLATCDASGAEAIGAGILELIGGRQALFEVEYACPSPTEDRWFLLRAVAAPVDGGRGALLLHLDVTRQHLVEASTGAGTDPATGLIDRARAAELVAGLVRRLGDGDAAVEVTTVALDGLSVVVEALGAAAGDQLVIQVVARLRRAVRRGDVLCRTGPSELAVVRPTADRDSGPVLAERLRTVLAEPYQVGAHEIALGLVVEAGRLGADGQVTVVPAADDGSGQVPVTRILGPHEWGAAEDASLSSAPSAADVESPTPRFAAMDELVHALVDAGEAPLAFQAITRLADGVVVGAEALLRVHDEGGSVVAPQEVFAAADRLGLSVELGCLVLVGAATEAARWRRAVPEQQLVVTVNLSPQQFHDRDLVAHVEATLDEAGLEPSRLCLEIPEAVLLADTAWSARQLAGLAMAGVSISVDDYGTGHTSLLHLKRFPLDTIKVDLSLVAGLPDSPEDLAVVTATMGVAQALDIRVVAVGVETERQLGELERLGCQYGQGFLWSTATTGDAFLALASAPPADRAPRALAAGPLVAPAPARAVSVEELDAILRSLVHEIRTPLTVAMGYASMLEVAPEDDRVGVASRIRAATERINRLLATLEDVRLIDHGTLVLDAHRLDLRAHVASVVGDLRGSTRRRLVLEGVGDHEVLVDADEARLAGALANLVTNALKYGQPGSPVVVRVAADEEWAQVTVLDDGPGVALADLGVIFRKYGRADRRHTGSGLGLYLARGTARAHGGDISYRREAGASAFTLALPRSRRGGLTADPVSRRRPGRGAAG